MEFITSKNKRFNHVVVKLFLLSFLMLISSTLHATEIRSFDNGNFSYKVLSQTGSTGTVAIKRKSGVNLDIALIIPSEVTYQGIVFKVTEIQNFGFSECGITSVSFPKSITRIGNYAFMKCSKLTGTVTIPGNVTSIGIYAFNNCPGIKGLVLSEGIKTIEGGAFSENKGLTGTLTLPNSLTNIGNDAFKNCSGFTGTLVIPNKVTQLGFDAFQNCTGFQSVVISEGIKQLSGEFQFNGCTGLKSCHLPKTMTKIPGAIFHNCTGLSGKLQIPENIIEIGNGAFKNCSGFTGTLVIPNKVTQIGFEAFVGCSGFTGTLYLPSSLTNIGGKAFFGCKNLQSVEIPNSVTSIGEYALPTQNHITSPSNLSYYNAIGWSSETTIPKFDDASKIGNCDGKSIFYLSNSLPQESYNGQENLFYKNIKNRNLYLKPSVYKIYKTSSEGEWWRNNSNMTDCVPLTIPKDRNWMTMCRDFDVDFRHTNDNLPSGVSPLKAYIVSDVDEASNAIILQEIKYVPSRLRSNEDGFKGYDEYVGVLLRGTPGYTYYYTIGEDDYTKGKDGQMTLEKALALSNASVPTSSATLVGANVPKYVTTEETVDGTTYKTYGLKNNEFCKYSVDGYVPYNKAYLRIPATFRMAAKEVVTIIFHDADGTTTSISSDSLPKTKYGQDFIFDLQGMKIAHPIKGKVYIQNGKKYLQK